MDRRDFLRATGLSTAGAAALAPAGTPAAAVTGTLRPVRAVQADRLCSSYLLNTKIFYAKAVYGYTDAVLDLLTELGVRVVRERITTGRSLGTRNQLHAMPRLAARGIRWHGTVANLEDWPHATAANSEVMDFLVREYAPRMDGDLSALMHSFGGCNEIDGTGRDGVRDPRWPEHARLMQQALYEQAKRRRLTADILVAGPSTRTDFTARRARQLGDLSRWSELGNGHLYNKGTSPTRGIDEHLRILRPCFPGVRDYLITETGYNNSPQDNLGRSVPEFGSAIYAVRGICDFFRRGAVYGRFELMDDPDPIDRSSQQSINATADREAHFGLVAMTKDTVRSSTPDTWRKKPEFYATKRLLHLMSDCGSAFRPHPLTMSVQCERDDLQHLLVQKRNGKHYLLLWRDVEVCERYPSARRLEVAGARVTVRFRTARPVRIWGPNRSADPLRRHPPRHSCQVTIRGDLKVLEIG